MQQFVQELLHHGISRAAERNIAMPHTVHANLKCLENIVNQGSCRLWSGQTARMAEPRALGGGGRRRAGNGGQAQAQCTTWGAVMVSSNAACAAPPARRRHTHNVTCATTSVQLLVIKVQALLQNNVS